MKLLALLALVAAAPLPVAFGTASEGTYRLSSMARLTERGAELKGFWIDRSRACSATRRLTVSIRVERTLGSAMPVERRRSRTGSAANCAEGGPNFGFDLTARSLGFACPDGRWRPGRYVVEVTTRDLQRKLAASANLQHELTRRC